MEFRILGPLEVLDDHGRPLVLGGPKQRALLAVLLLHAGQVVSADRLIDELWGEDPPETARSVLQVYVANLRRILAPSGHGSNLMTRSRCEVADDAHSKRYKSAVLRGPERL